MSYRLPALSYDYSALEPYIDAGTMEIHHTRHHAGYVGNLNRLLEGQEEIARTNLEVVLGDIRSAPEEIRQPLRNHGGGHLNHSLFWQVMGPGKGGEPTGTLLEAMDLEFGSFPRFRGEFCTAAAGRFGSGWGWLGVDHNGRLEVFGTPNQDSPYMLGVIPILGLDVWEHAYYLNYQNRRNEYIGAWWNVVNWDMVAKLYSEALETLKIAHEQVRI